MKIYDYGSYVLITRAHKIEAASYKIHIENIELIKEILKANRQERVEIRLIKNSIIQLKSEYPIKLIDLLKEYKFQGFAIYSKDFPERSMLNYDLFTGKLNI